MLKKRPLMTVDKTMTTDDAWAKIRQVGQRLQGLRITRSRLTGYDTERRMQIKRLSIKIRQAEQEHAQLRQLLIERGQIDG